MKIKPAHLYAPKSTLGLKRLLLSLNRDLDYVKRDIQFNGNYGMLFKHSISAYSNQLTNIEIATLFLEDRRFFTHYGFELRSFMRAFKRYALQGSLNGMSTIDQQVIRISLGRYEKSVFRKLNEITLAIFLNLHVSKRRIFDYYIHNAYLGYRIEGCEVASNKIFAKPAAQLNEAQAAFVASLFPLPFPSSVWEAYAVHPCYPFSDPSEILDFANDYAPRWAARMSYRMKIALTSYDRMPRSL
ncbi:biosynthetic peptidoglycan transglycosylase [Tritonibacter mobilis]|uniref:biosynthetic peptidoglycan transglycosylase n=1 Tax=Tritonibacter mobilis TaxID=379347 RepID=UPI001447EE63|nr:transglycosylase domain-containing protein [Rhodobacteraceae bacterium R_SAG5]